MTIKCSTSSVSMLQKKSDYFLHCTVLARVHAACHSVHHNLLHVEDKTLDEIVRVYLDKEKSFLRWTVMAFAHKRYKQFSQVIVLV